MNYRILVLITFVIFISACVQKKDRKASINMLNEDTISNVCQDKIYGAKWSMHLDKLKKSHYSILETDSKTLDNITIKQVLIEKIKFPLDNKNIFIDIFEDNRAVAISYTDYINEEYFFVYVFLLSDTSNIYINGSGWYNSNNYTLESEELIKCLDVNDYCLLIVKVYWLPYLEELKTLGFDKDIYNKSKYDSLLKVFAKPSLDKTE